MVVTLKTMKRTGSIKWSEEVLTFRQDFQEYNVLYSDSKFRIDHECSSSTQEQMPDVKLLALVMFLSQESLCPW